MQKDVHFYLTYAVARHVGIGPQKAKEIAWADQYTDDLTKTELHGIQTQCGTLGNWGDKQIQLSVLIPFHFIPGGSPASTWPWEVTEDNARAQALVTAALTREPTLTRCALGIALHALQDTFSHQGFSGWQEKRNSCGFWYLLPNIGHTDMRHDPDDVGKTWTDPRTKKRIVNRWRALRAARRTFDVLAEYHGLDQPAARWHVLKQKLLPILKEKTYDNRKKKLATLAGNANLRYSNLSVHAWNKHKVAFVRAAAEHLSDAIGQFADLSR